MKYGVTRDYVLGLEVVTGRRRGRATRPPDREGRRRLRPDRAVRRIRGHPGHRHRDHRAAAAASGPGRPPWSASSHPVTAGEAVAAVARPAWCRRRWS